VRGAVNMYARARQWVHKPLVDLISQHAYSFSLDTMLSTLQRLKKMNDQLSQYKHQYEVLNMLSKWYSNIWEQSCRL
jgi:hypothetical protein